MLTVAVAAPLSAALHDFIVARHPDVELLWEPELMPPMRWPGDYSGDPNFSRSPEQQARYEAMLDSADIIYSIPDVSRVQLKRTVEANDRLQWVMAMAAGGGAMIKAAGLSAADLERIVFTTTAGVHAGPLSEFVLFGLLCGAKYLLRLQADQRAHRWPSRWTMGQLEGSTIAVVGMGHLGRAVAAKLTGLGAQVIGVNKTVREVPGVDMVGIDQLAEAVAVADGVVSTLPGTDATAGMISAEVLRSFKPGATFVSIGRGTVVDEGALVDALADGTVGFAALDVFASEPLSPASPLWDLPNVLISPHTAANSTEEERLIAELFCDNLDRFKKGQPLLNVVDTKHFY